MAILSGPYRRVAALVVAFAIPASAPANAVSEYDVKAAFLFNFTRFVSWPQPSANSSSVEFCIGISGADPFGGSMEQAVKGRTVGGHPIAVRHFKPGAETGCEVVFIVGNDVRKMRTSFNRLQGTPVLTVGEAPGFCQGGGIIGFRIEDNNVKLEINPDAAQRSGLQISSKLLALASLVREPGQ